MYTAQIVNGVFYVSYNGNGKMRARTKIGIVRLIMSNLVARRNAITTIVCEDNAKYTELDIVRCEGRLFVQSVFSIKSI